MTDTATNVPTAHDHDGDAHHPTERQYWMVFAALVVLTALEVAWSFIGLDGIALAAPLLIMMVIKFLLVAGVFMHLYFDMKILNGRLFTWMFVAGMVLAMAVYAVVFSTFEFNI